MVINMYKVMIDEFEGPLHLLLHLIKQKNIDIYNIKIGEVTKQYLDYIKQMENMNLDIASEYLTMAAELIEMKAKTLLPSNDLEEDDYEEERITLINKLIDYKKYQEISNDFKELEQLRKLIITKEPDNLGIYQSSDLEIPTEEVDLNDLINAFKKFLERKKQEKPLNTKIATKEISIEERSIEIKQKLKATKKLKFVELFEILNKEYVVVTFLSVLDMAKKKEIQIKQEDNFNEIYLMLRGEQDE